MAPPPPPPDAPRAAGDHVETDQREIVAEFLIAPFVEGNPGVHVTAGVEAFAAHGITADLGPFATSATGELDEMTAAIAAMIRDAMRGGATSVQLRVAASADEIPVPSLHDALDDIVRMAEHELGAPPREWDRADKQRVVRMFDERGAFLLRGAVDDIAEIMGVSRITIYNYLNALHADTDEPGDGATP